MKLKLLPQLLLKELSEKVLQSDLQKHYEYFINNYGEGWKASDKGFCKEETEKINPIYRNVIRDLNGLIGIDLPTLFESNSASGKLMILAQDPLRRAKDFKHEGKVIIGTPYALHSKLYREGSSKLYFNLLNELNDLYKEFYLTDVVKVYAEASNIIGLLSKKNSKNIRDAAYNMLAFEINTIMPNIILAMGKVAHNALNDSSIKLLLEENKIQRIDTPHIRARHDTWLKAGAEGSKDGDKIRYLYKKIKKA